jgi:hypothetical protein
MCLIGDLNKILLETAAKILQIWNNFGLATSQQQNVVGKIRLLNLKYLNLIYQMIIF